MKIFAKYSLILGSLLLLCAGGITALALRHHGQALRREALLRAESIAVNLALVSADAILTRNVLQLLPLAMDATTRHANIAYAAVVDSKGRVLAHPDRAAIDQPFQFQASGELRLPELQSEVLDGLGMGAPLWDVSVPVKAKGSLLVLGRVHVGLDKRAVEASLRESLRQLVLASLLSLALGLGLAFQAVRMLVRPLRELSEASRRVGEGDFSAKVRVPSRDELGTLAANFNAMADNLATAAERRAVQARLESELSVAHKIQDSLLPKEAPKFPSLEMAFFCEPAKELGGDYYDWAPVEGGRKLGFIVADVSGKGVPAALHMANLRNLFRFVSQELSSPLETVKRLNALASPDLGGEAFITLVYGILDPGSGELRYVNAGHDPVFLQPSSGAARALDATAFPVGMVEPAEFDAAAKEGSLMLAPGELLLLYTDGVTEAANPAGEQFGLERIRELLPGENAAAALEKIKLALALHLAGMAPEDDVTLLCLRRLPAA